MSQRETQVGSSVQLWKGVNQRIQPTLVPDGYFTMASGVIFGFESGNITRLAGKKAAGKLTSPVLSIFQLGDITIIQKLDGLVMASTADLIAFAI